MLLLASYRPALLKPTAQPVTAHLSAAEILARLAINAHRMKMLGMTRPDYAGLSFIFKTIRRR